MTKEHLLFRQVLFCHKIRLRRMEFNADIKYPLNKYVLAKYAASFSNSPQPD